MSNTSVTYLVAACAGTFSLAAFIGFVVVPAWGAYGTWWERLAATFLSLYVLVTLVVVGAVAGLGVVWFWDRF